MLDRVLLLLYPLRNRPKLPQRFIRREIPSLARRMTARLHQQKLVVPRLPYTQVEPLIRLLVHLRIAGGIGPRHMPPEPVIPLRHIVFRCIEQRLRIRRPRERSHPLRAIFQISPCP